MHDADPLARRLGALLGRMGLGRGGVRSEVLREAGVRGIGERNVRVYLPPEFENGRAAPLLVMLDGQTAAQWRLEEALAVVVADRLAEAPVVAAVPASAARLDEHGTADVCDYEGRGRLAKLFQDYLGFSVVPAVRERYGLEHDPQRTGIFGASMGGLCAFDTAWRHPDVFGLAGVFSGSLWWRTDNSNPAAQQASRIAHRRVRGAHRKPGLRLWFQAGTDDERSDRDGDGVIDAIQDTRELIGELTAKGFHEGADVVYREIAGGRHDEATWARVLPEFLRWAWPRR